jgi:hypothetical protein
MGSVIVAAEVTAAIRRHLDLEGFAARSLRVVPDHFLLSSPLTEASVGVVAVDAQGNEVDVSGPAMASLGSIPADFLVVQSDGRVRATRRGRALLQVRFGDVMAEVPVEARWPDVMVADDAVAGPAGECPCLVAAGSPGTASEGLSVVCAGLPVGTPCALAKATFPLPSTPPVDWEGHGIHLQTLDGTSSTPVPVINGRIHLATPLFVRAYAVSADSGKVLAASNTLVLTLD